MSGIDKDEKSLIKNLEPIYLVVQSISPCFCANRSQFYWLMQTEAISNQF